MRKPSPSFVLAALALFFALGGSAFAARHYLVTSTTQIKPSVLKKLRGAKGAKGSSGANGLPGPAGPAGPAGPVSVSTLTAAPGNDAPIPASGAASSTATCPAGQHAVSGGGHTNSLSGLASSEMTTDHQSWFVIAANTTSSATVHIQATVYCAASGQAVAASHRTRYQPSAQTRREVAAAVARMRQK